jgi:hypothetical protein
MLNVTDYEDHSDKSAAWVAERKSEMSLLVDKKYGRGNKATFPKKLYEMLSSESKRNSAIIRFLPHGRAFKIYDREKFRDKVLRNYFQFQTEFTSFRRQLNIYGFRRLKGKGTDQHAYYHCNFLRGRPDLCELVLRNKRASRKTDQVREPDFIAMAAMPDYASSERTPVKSRDEIMKKDALGSEDWLGPAEAMLFHLCEAAAICAPGNASLEQHVQCCNRSANCEAVASGSVNSNRPVPWSCRLQSTLMPMEWRSSAPEPWYRHACSESELVHGIHPTRPSRSSTINSRGQTQTSRQLEEAILLLGPEDVSQLHIRADQPIADLLDMTKSSGSEMADWLRDIDLN